jgi:nucleotide-binding universal stress UspA family protein
VTAPVVVAVDGSLDGRRALHMGVDLATQGGVPLRLIHVRHDNIVLTPGMPLLPEPGLDEVATRVLHESLADARRMRWRAETRRSPYARRSAGSRFRRL